MRRVQLQSLASSSFRMVVGVALIASWHFSSNRSIAAFIDFDSAYPDGSLPVHGEAVSSQYSSLGILVTGDAPRIQSEAGQASSAVNVLLSYPDPQLLVLDFFDLPALTVEFDLISVGFAGAIVRAFGESGTLLETVNVHHPELGTAFGQLDTILFDTTSSTEHIRTISIMQMFDSIVDLIAVDTLRFTLAARDPDPDPNPVPEPNTLALVVAAISIAGVGRNYRRRRNANSHNNTGNISSVHLISN